MRRKAKGAVAPVLTRAAFCAIAAERAGVLWDELTAIVGAVITGANRAVLELTTAEVIKAFELPEPEPVAEVAPIAKRRGRPPKSATATSSPTTSPREPAPPAPRRAPRVQGLPQATKPQRPRAAPPRIEIEPEELDEVEDPDEEPEPVTRKPRKPSGRAPALGMRPEAIRAELARRAAPQPFEPDIATDGPTLTVAVPTVAELEASKRPGTLPAPRSSHEVKGW